MQDCRINFRKFAVHECGAILVSLLAYPNDDKGDSHRANLHASLCALSLRARFIDSPDETTLQSMKPIHAFRDLKEISKDLKTFKRRLRDRMAAARMVIPFLNEAQTGKPPILPASAKRLSINQMAEIVIADTGQSDAENVETRIWRPSLPVIHLAAATAVLIDFAEKNGARALSVGDLICNRPAIEHIILQAELYEALLAKSQKLKIDPNKLIKVRLAG